MKKGQTKFLSKLLLPKTSLAESVYKEYENIELSELFDEKDPLYVEYLKSDAELVKLKSDLQTFRKKARLRENELRTHIYELSEKLKVRDVFRLKSNMNNLKDEIIDNINIITERTRDEIMARKAEISKRTQTRLMDTEVRHQDVLSDRVRDQDDIVKNLNDYTREMEKVNSNYMSIRRKVENLTKENTGYKIMIQEFDFKNAKLKIELTKLKKLMVLLKLKVGQPLDQNRNKNDETNNNQDVGKEKTQFSGNSNLEDGKYNEESKSVEMNNSIRREIDDDCLNNKKFPNFNMEKINEILSSENFLKTYPRSSAVISSLGNILENSNLRLDKLKREIDCKRQSTDVTDIVLAVLKNSKENLASSDDLNLHKLIKKNKVCSMVFKNEVYMSRDQRKQFINNLVNNAGILNIIHNENFPSGTLINRKIVIPK